MAHDVQVSCLPRRTLSRTLTTLLAAACLGALLAAAAPASGVPQPSGDPKPGRILIGDSVSGGAAAALRARGFTVDWSTSRQFYELPGMIRSIRTSLPADVVIALGTNGTIELEACRAAVRLIGPKRTAFFVTNRVPRIWQDGNNRTLRRCVESFPTTRAILVDWHTFSQDRAGWFYSDGYHLIASTGGVGYARFIDKAVDQAGAPAR